MKKELAGKNVVLVGIFQPQRFDRYFFVKNEIFRDEEIAPISAFNNDTVQLITESVNIIVLNQQIIINQNDFESNRYIEVAKKFIILNNEQIRAMGINFSWNLYSTDSLENTTKKLFYNENNSLLNEFFNTPDSIYGSYVSKNYKTGRLKLEMKPQVVKRITSNEEKTVSSFVNFAFNFHFEFNNRNPSDQISTLDQFGEMLSESNKIISIYE